MDESLSVKHVVQSQTYVMKIHVSITFNPQNKRLTEEEAVLEHQGNVVIDLGGHSFGVKGFIREGENYSDLTNRLMKVAILKASNKLFPTDMYHEFNNKPDENTEV